MVTSQLFKTKLQKLFFHSYYKRKKPIKTLGDISTFRVEMSPKVLLVSLAYNSYENNNF